MAAGSMAEAKRLMNCYGENGVPFFFLIDFLMKMPEVHRLDQLPRDIRFSLPLLPDTCQSKKQPERFQWDKEPVSYDIYLNAFSNVQRNIKLGNSYLLNLTFPTILDTDLTLSEIYDLSVAKYKLLYNDLFVVFSPEIFVRIAGGRIFSNPMKGTISDSIPDAENVILNDAKEMAEHDTIVDLIRNDLSIVSNNVRVKKYRYIDRIETNDKVLLQVSSEITGDLLPDYQGRLGDIVFSMLPAGSVTGAPKKETVRIIRESENYERGWYTGVFGIFNGKELDSGVMIRFVENSAGKLIFKSGGGITYLSNPESEYDELISKVYVPVG
jgi:para-aminobenzoate synthetase component 1